MIDNYVSPFQGLPEMGSLPGVQSLRSITPGYCYVPSFQDCGLSKFVRVRPCLSVFLSD
jgi:hypothetical protein